MNDKVEGEDGSPYRVDVHCHHIPDFYRLSLEEHGLFTAGGIPFPAWSPELAVHFMDNYSIQVQVVSISEPGVYYLRTADERCALARRINDYTTETLVRSSNPTLAGRFGGFAVLPLGDLGNPSDTKHAAAEAERSLTRLGMDGVGLYSNYHGVYLGDPRFGPLLKALNDLGAMVFIHPVTPPAAPDIPTSKLTFLYEFPFDTTRSVVSMLYANVFNDYPNIRWLVAHAGGTIPFLAYRTSLLSPGNTHYSKLFYDTALSPAPSAMKSVREVTDVSHILFATDWPFSSALFPSSGNPAPQLAETFDAQELRRVERLNALAQFPNLVPQEKR
ncbi:amidohydrolase [Pendulispora rubella]|uniref:Amidohydrolase n=1 Tax=Pendulispora rubella TaxID=2741070 RepID=A0ABZ2KS48_9BACT